MAISDLLIPPSNRKTRYTLDSDRKIVNRRRTLISPVPQRATGRSEFVPYIDADDTYSLPAGRSTGDGGGQPQVSPPILDNSSPKKQSTTVGDTQPDLNLPAPDGTTLTQLAIQSRYVQCKCVCHNRQTLRYPTKAEGPQANQNAIN